ncbi:MAG: ABC transporter substrate-binding protein [Rhodospirillales bacterium]
MTFRPIAAALVAVLAAGADPAAAKDQVKLVDSQATIFDHFAIYQAQKEGYFEAENLDVSVIVGRGGADSLQAVVTGAADIIYGTGSLGVVSAYSKGAPVAIIASARRGAGDVFWYVRADSPIKSLKDLDGKGFAYSSPGSVTSLITNTIVKELGIKPKLIATGAMAASRTQVMSGQTDTAWSGFPSNLGIIRSGEARIIGTGDAAESLRGITIRVTAANTNWLAKNRDVATRFLRALWKGQQYNFSGPQAIERYAAHWKLDAADAKLVNDFFKIEDLTYGTIGKQDLLLQLAQEYNFLKAPLSDAEQKKMVDILYDAKP